MSTDEVKKKSSDLPSIVRDERTREENKETPNHVEMLTDCARVEPLGLANNEDDHRLKEAAADSEEMTSSCKPSHGPLECDICGDFFPDVREYENHMFSHENDRPYSCTVCGKSFKYSHHLSEHVKFHSGETSYSCEDCGKTFESLMALSGHVKVHKRAKSLTCEYCKKTFARTDHLNIHRRLHTGDKPYTCDICGKKLADSSNFIKHKQSHSRNADAPFACDVCDKRFKREGDRSRHVRLNHAGARLTGASRGRRVMEKVLSPSQNMANKANVGDAENCGDLNLPNSDTVTRESLVNSLPEFSLAESRMIQKIEDTQVFFEEEFQSQSVASGKDRTSSQSTVQNSGGRRRMRKPSQPVQVRRSQRVHRPRVNLSVYSPSEEFDNDWSMENPNATPASNRGRHSVKAQKNVGGRRGKQGGPSSKLNSTLTLNQGRTSTVDRGIQVILPPVESDVHASVPFCRNGAGSLRQSLEVKREPCSLQEMDMRYLAEGQGQLEGDVCTIVQCGLLQIHVHLASHAGSDGEKCHVCRCLVRQMRSILQELHQHSTVHAPSCSVCNKTFASSGLLESHVCQGAGASTASQVPSEFLQPSLTIHGRNVKTEVDPSVSANNSATKSSSRLPLGVDRDDDNGDDSSVGFGTCETEESGEANATASADLTHSRHASQGAASGRLEYSLMADASVVADNGDADDMANALADDVTDDVADAMQDGAEGTEARILLDTEPRSAKQGTKASTCVWKGSHLEGRYQCKVCHCKFRSPKALSHHVVRRHRAETQSRCEVCGLLVRPGNLIRHRAAHKKGKLFRRGVVKDERGFHCRHCEGVFPTKVQVTQHTRQVHSEPFLCGECGQIFKHAIHLRRHQIVHSSARPHICDVCGKDFKTVSAVKKHLFSHATGTSCVCEICGSSFKSPLHLSKHSVTHAANRRTYICELCGKSFKTPRNLTQHQKTHSRVRTAEICDGEEEQCEICSEKLKNSRALKFHKWNVHKDPGEDKKFMCKVCSRPFSRKAELQVHLRSHTGEKPFTCQLCGSKIGYKSSFKVHMKRHSQCSLCSEWCIDSEALRRHLEMHHSQVQQIMAPLPSFLG